MRPKGGKYHTFTNVAYELLHATYSGHECLSHSFET